MSYKLFIFGVILLGGCSFVPDYVRPKVDFTNQWNGLGVSTTEVSGPAEWWTAYGSDELNSLILKALDQNHDLVAATERIAQARGSLRVAGAGLYPNVSAGLSRTDSWADLGNGGVSGEKSGAWAARAAASYELDLFGATRSSKAAARARLEAAGFDRDALALTTASDVAQTYFNYLAMNERRTLAEQSLATSREILRLLELRLTAGAVGLLEVSQQRASVASAEANVASLREQEVALKTALAILVGIAPQDFTVQATTLDGIVLPDVAVNPPASLLAQRPDLKVAEANLKAANGDIGAARAAFFPSLNLSANLAQAIDPARTGLTLGADLLAPIFSGGANAGNLQVATARQRELAAAYRQAVLTSFGEATNALATLQSADTRLASQGVATESAATALRLARLQLDAGTVDLPTLLSTQAADLAARDAVVQARADALGARVQVRRVMGR